MEKFEAGDEPVLRRKGLGVNDLINETEENTLEEETDFCEELEETLDDDVSLASSYDCEVAKNHDCQVDDPVIRQENHMKKLNRFHKDAIRNMAKKSTAKFRHLNTFSSKILKNKSSKKLRNQPVSKLMSFAF